MEINPYFPQEPYTDFSSTWATLSIIHRSEGSVNPDFDEVQQFHTPNSSLRNQGGSLWPLQPATLTGWLDPALKASYIINGNTAE